MNFLKTVLAVIVGFFIALSIALFALIGIASTFAPKEETFVVEDNAILKLNFTEPVYEYGALMRVKDFDYEIAQENTLHFFRSFRIFSLKRFCPNFFTQIFNFHYSDRKSVV